MTPYEVFFFSSGGVEEKWTRKDLGEERANVFLGFPLGGLLSLAIMACAALVLLPRGIEVSTLGRSRCRWRVALGKVGLAFALVGFVAATFGAALRDGPLGRLLASPSTSAGSGASSCHRSGRAGSTC